MEKIFLIIAVVVLAGSMVQTSFAVEQNLMDSYYKNVSDQILDTEHIAISNYVDYINETLSQ